MTDPADRFLEERLHALASGADVPVVPPAADVRRGRRRLLRMRVAMGGATTATLAVVLGVTSLTAGDPKASEVPAVDQPTTSLPTTPSSTPSASDPGSDGGAGGRGGGSRPSRVGSSTVGGDDGLSTEPVGSQTAPGGAPVKNAPSGASTGTADAGDHAGSASSDPLPTETVTSTPSSTPSEDPSGSPTTDPTGPPTTDPTDPPTTDPPPPPPTTGRVRVHQVLRYYNDVLAERLDLRRAHLQPYDRDVDPRQVVVRDGQLFALGSTYRWASARTPAALGITVASGWDQVAWECGASSTDWACHVGPTAGSEVARHDGLLQVAVEHSSGQVVVLSADPTRDPAQRAAGDAAGSEADLVAAASDPRLILPGTAPVAPPTIAVDGFAQAGIETLVRTGETFTQTGTDRTPWVRGEWAGAADGRATLAWTAQPVYSGGAFSCLPTYRSCSEVVVDADGTTVHLALLGAKAGGGWLVQYDGPSYGVRVWSSSRTFPKKRAYGFVTAPSWQPVR